MLRFCNAKLLCLFVIKIDIVIVKECIIYSQYVRTGACRVQIKRMAKTVWQMSAGEKNNYAKRPDYTNKQSISNNAA